MKVYAVRKRGAHLGTDWQWVPLKAAFFYRTIDRALEDAQIGYMKGARQAKVVVFNVKFGKATVVKKPWEKKHEPASSHD